MQRRLSANACICFIEDFKAIPYQTTQILIKGNALKTSLPSQ